MRILIVSNLYPPNVVGGYERLCFDVTAGLAALGHEMVVLTSRHGGKLAEYPAQRILRELDLLTGHDDIYAPFAGSTEDRAAIGRRNVQTLERVLREIRPDVVFAWNLFFLDAEMLTTLERSRLRTVVMLTDNWLLVMRNPVFVSEFFRDTIHGDAPLVVPRVTLRQRLRRWLARVLPGADTSRLEAIFGSGYMRDLYRAGGIDFARHRIIHNGVRQAPQPATGPDRARLVEQGTLRLLFAGRFVDLKGAHVAVEAMALLDRARLGVACVRLTLVGDAQDRAYMARLTDAIARSPRAADIELHPAVAEQALPALFDAHDIYLFPSLYEPFSLTLIHALACGIPTIASRAGGNPEIVRDGQSGLLSDKGSAADLARAIGELAADPPLRARLSRGGRLAAAQFTFARMVGEMAGFLASR